MTLTAQIHTDAQALADLEGEWNALLARSRSDSIFLTWEWIAAWREAVAPHAPLLLVTVRDPAHRLVAVAPFYRTRMRLLGAVPYRVARVLGDFHSGSEYPDLIIDREVEDAAASALVEALLARRNLWDCLWLPRMAGWTGARERWRALCEAHGLWVHEHLRDFAPVDLREDFEGFLGTLSRNTRSSLRRRMRDVLDGDGATFCLCTPDDREEFLDALFRLHAQRWATRGDEGSFRRQPHMEAFYRRFIPEAQQRGWLRLYGLRLGGELKAVQIGYVYGGTYSQLQEGFCPSAPDGVGNVLRALSIESLIAEGVRCYDFLGEWSEHKRRWGATLRKGCDLFIGRPNLRTRLLFCREIWPFGRFLVEDHPAGAKGKGT